MGQYDNKDMEINNKPNDTAELSTYEQAALEEGTDFRVALGIRFLERGLGYAKAEMDILPWHLNALGVVHGGCLFSLADTTSGASALGRGGRVTTVNGSINYLKAGKNTAKIMAEAHEIKYGKTLSVCEAKIYNDKEELLATTTMTFFHLKDA